MSILPTLNNSWLGFGKCEATSASHLIKSQIWLVSGTNGIMIYRLMLFKKIAFVKATTKLKLVLLIGNGLLALSLFLNLLQFLQSLMKLWAITSSTTGNMFIAILKEGVAKP